LRAPALVYGWRHVHQIQAAARHPLAAGPGETMRLDVVGRALFADLKIGGPFSTPPPFGHAFAIGAPHLGRASWALPLAGVLVALVGAAAYWLAHAAGLPSLSAGALALTATLLATGCLHEDGLADVADGFGGGATRERKLAIMRDSRIGSYGTCALILSLLPRASATASPVAPASVPAALVS